MYECTALHPGPPERDVEEWPLLDLSDATVVRFRRDQPSELVDLFEVVACSEETVRVMGRLEKVPKGWAKCVRTPDVYKRTLVIPKVATFSMEIGPSGEPVIWVLGASAWYRIRPSTEYAAYYKELQERARVWLFLLDKYTAVDRSMVQEEQIKDVWREYANVGLGCGTARTASRIFDRHHRFLLHMMLKPEENVEMWKDTPVYRHFMQEHEDTVLEALHFHGHITEEQRRGLPVPATPPPAPVPDSDSEEEDSKNPDQSDDQLAAPPPVSIPDDAGSDSEEEDSNISLDSDDDRATPSGDDRSTRGKTVSTKGRSSLRPRRSEAPLDPESLPPPLEDASPSDLRVKRRLEPSESSASHLRVKRRLDSSDADAGTPLKRQVFVSPSPAPPPQPPPPSPPPSQMVEGAQPFWRCTLDEPGCSYVVLNPKTRDGRNAMEKHYEAHGQVMQDAREIIEMEADKYQVDHLREKVMMMTRKWEENKPSPLKGLGDAW